MRKTLILLAVLGTSVFSMNAQKSEKDIIKKLEQKSDEYGNIAQNIWEFAEMGYQEEQSSGLLQKTLKDAGFSIKTGVAEKEKTATSTAPAANQRHAPLSHGFQLCLSRPARVPLWGFNVPSPRAGITQGPRHIDCLCDCPLTVVVTWAKSDIGSSIGDTSCLFQTALPTSLYLVLQSCQSACCARCIVARQISIPAN